MSHLAAFSVFDAGIFKLARGVFSRLQSLLFMDVRVSDIGSIAPFTWPYALNPD